MSIRFGGFLECSFNDWSEHLCSVGFVTGCNLRCKFCHNPQLLDEKQCMSEQDVLDGIERLAGKNDCFCLSGGEPTIYGYENLKDFITKAKKINKNLKIKLDTNGHLSRSLICLLDDKLIDYVAVDFKAWDSDSYKMLCGAQGNYENVLTSIHCLDCYSKETPFEIRTTVIDGVHNKNNLEKMFHAIKETSGKGTKLFLQRYRAKTTLDADENWKTPQDCFLSEMAELANKIELDCSVR